jgi:hypothetical protein
MPRKPRKNEPDDADFAAALEGLMEALDRERGGPPGGRTLARIAHRG